MAHDMHEIRGRCVARDLHTGSRCVARDLHTGGRCVARDLHTGGRCVARDLHTMAPWPLERTCWRVCDAVRRL